MSHKTTINKYIADTVANRTGAGKLANLRVHRHIRDLETCYERGMYFDEAAALKVLKFFNFMRHVKGSQFAGKKFELAPWQMFDIYCIYGWMTTGGRRRFRYAYTDIARKNGKTTFAAGQGLYLLMMDKEPGAEIYTVATKREQARICLDDARNIAKSSPDIKQYTQTWQHSVTCEMLGASMKALSSDSNTLDGLNPHGIILDEFHAHKDDMVFNVMKSAMGARSQPLMLILTTAGFNRNVPCYGYRDVGIKVLEGVLEQDDSYYSIHTLDAGDDYHDEDNWIKSNPNLGTSVSMGFLRDEYKSAINNPSQLYNFLTKNLNIWTDSHKNWLPFDIWQLGNKGDEELEGAECYGGLDLASTRDTNSLALCFAKPDGTFSFKVFCWMPEMNVEERVKNKGINYDRWIREGWITSTPGNITDYDFIEADIVALAQKYKIKAINYDRWNSSQLVIKLIEQGLPMQAFGQGYASMSAPTKEFERLVMSEKINHFGNPVFTWHISNVSLQRDPAGNIKIDKERSSEKVDAAVSSVMALAAWMIANGNPGQPDLNQIYKSNGIRTL